MRNDAEIKARLHLLGLSEDEAAIFVCLLGAPKPLLEVSRITGITRSNVYRIADKLIEKSLAHEVTSINGRALVSVRPEALELLVVEQEKEAKASRENYSQMLPLLSNLKERDTLFATQTYVGVAGLKQMLWNELKSQSEILMFSYGQLELAVGQHWAEKYRAESVRRGLMHRSIENIKARPLPLHGPGGFANRYIMRELPPDVLAINHEMTIHDDTISFYNSWDDHVLVGTEIKNPFLANFMRQMFEHYWQLAKDAQDPWRLAD
ncbi:MAG TPA: hypothetical protein VJR27_01650 [Candidatus Saccharimonadales bacterium]|nr:hypothetical protein [Candidatus Saccharimonadales bacterium]